MIYFDNSATTYPKPKSVIKAVTSAFELYGANPGRSGHSFNIKTATKIEEIRQDIADFINAESSSNIIFTGSCTEALNLAIFGSHVDGGHIICTINDHNSMLRPIFHLKKLGLAEVSVVIPKNKQSLELSDILPHVKPNTNLICCNHISNVDGMIANINEIGNFCNQNCITFLVDAAQSIGHKKIDMIKDHIDLLAFAPHKGLYAPMGVGVLAISNKVKLNPIKFGGTGTNSFSINQPTDMPEGFESGTLPVPAIIGLGEGLKFVRRNFEKINNKLDDLSSVLNHELGNIPNVNVLTHPNNSTGVIAFTVNNIDSIEITELLDKKYNIMVRGGLHCAPLKHKTLGTTQNGVVRVSLSCFNTYDECVKFIKIIKNIAKNS